MQLDCTTLVTVLKSGGVSSVRLFELAQPLLQDKEKFELLCSKLIDAMVQEFDWSEECKKPLPLPFFERAYEFLIAVLPLDNSKSEGKLFDLFAFNERFLACQLENPDNAQQQLILMAERINDKIIDIFNSPSEQFFDLHVKRYNRLLNILFGTYTSPTFYTLALQRLITHISHTIIAVSPDAALAALSYLLTDMTININLWTIETMSSLFNHATRLALSMTADFQHLFARSLIMVIKILASNKLVYSFFEEKRILVLTQTLLRDLMLVLDNQDTLDQIKRTVDATYFLTDISILVLSLDDQDLNGQYNRLSSTLNASSRNLNDSN